MSEIKKKLILICLGLYIAFAIIVVWPDEPFISEKLDEKKEAFKHKIGRFYYRPFMNIFIGNIPKSGYLQKSFSIWVFERKEDKFQSIWSSRKSLKPATIKIKTNQLDLRIQLELKSEIQKSSTNLNKQKIIDDFRNSSKIKRLCYFFKDSIHFGNIPRKDVFIVFKITSQHYKTDEKYEFLEVVHSCSDSSSTINNLPQPRIENNIVILSE